MTKNIRYLNIYTACLSALFCLPVLYPYFQMKTGLSFRDFMLTEAIFAGAVILLEVPTGWLSDIWTRKHVLFLSCLFWGLSFLGFVLASNIWFFILAQISAAISVSFSSGTQTAILYDSLLAQGKQEQFSKYEGKRNAISFYSLAIAASIGGLLYHIHPTLPFYMSVGMCIPALYCVYKLIEPMRVKEAAKGNPIKDMMKTLHYAIHGHAEVAVIILFSAILFSGTKTLFWVQQPYYQALAIPEMYFGILMAIGWILGGIGSQLSHHMEGRISNIRFLSLILCILICACTLAGLFVSKYSIVFIIMGSIIYGLADPRIKDAINKRVGSERRATILSTKNLLVELFFIPVSLIAGWASDMGSTSNALYTIVVWLMLAIFCLGAWEYYKLRKSYAVT